MAMVRGLNGRDLWIDVASLAWLVSFAADELSRHGIVSPYVAPKHITTPNPNVAGCPGLWRQYDHNYKRYMFEFVEQVDGLPLGEVGVRRYLSLGSITDSLWKTFGTIDPDFHEASLGEKRAVALAIITAWCDAILHRTEHTFVSMYELPRWKDNKSTAPAAPNINALCPNVEWASPVEDDDGEDEEEEEEASSKKGEDQEDSLLEGTLSDTDFEHE
jgi:hypothetical protein